VTRVRFVEPARLEVLAEVGYYHRVEAGLGAKFLEALEDAIARALAYPLAGSPAQNRTRRVFLRDFPFALVYRFIGGAEQMTANIKIQKTGVEVASYAEAMSRF